MRDIPINAQEAMTSRARVCRPGDALDAVAGLMETHDVGFLPVVDGDPPTLVGAITDRDICLALARYRLAPHQLTARDCMARDPAKVNRRQDIRVALNAMVERRVRRLPVVDDTNTVVGVLAWSDLLWACSRPGRVPCGAVAAMLAILGRMGWSQDAAVQGEPAQERANAPQPAQNAHPAAAAPGGPNDPAP